MKRNFFPFLGIAFVVAIAATGVFYGLFVDKISGAPAAAVNAGELVAVSRAVPKGTVLSARDLRVHPAGAVRPDGAFRSVEEAVGRTTVKSLAAGDTVTSSGVGASTQAAELSIPKGMRAISIRVADSAGLVPYLRARNRIDVQSITGNGSGETRVSTLLANVEVLSVHLDAAGQPGGTVVNLLVTARDVERVALADSSAKVRIVMRNAEDSEAPLPERTNTRAAAAPGPRVQFQVQIAVASANTVRDMTLRSRPAPGENGSVRIGLLPADWNADSAMLQMEKDKAVRLLSTKSVGSSQWEEVSLRAGGEGPGDYDFRLRLLPRGGTQGVLRLRLRPELSLPQRGGVSSRRFSADLNVASGQSILLAGFEHDLSIPALVEKLFPSPGASGRSGEEIFFVVTPRVAAW